MRQLIDKNFLISKSKPHPSDYHGKGRQLKICNSNVTFSIVGGSMGFYGDFDHTFEVAVFDNETNKFVTRFFFPNTENDVCPFLPLDQLLEVLNNVFKTGFRVP